MYEINLTYFLFGTLIFTLIRLIDMLKMFNPDFEATSSYQKVFYLLMGLIFLLSGINGIIFQLKLEKIIPIIFILIVSGLFISDTFVKPSKNYLISICLGIGTGAPLVVPFFHLFQDLRLQINIPYLSLVGIGISFLIGLAVGIFTYILLYYKYQNGLEEFWDGTRVWRILNNKIFILILWILIIIETYLQLHITSLLSMFYQF